MITYDTKTPWEARQFEEKLAPYETRDAYEIDRARIIHSPCFRRLQSKTQVIGLSDGDYHRTRLTHTMEVAQIGRGLAQRLRKDYEGKPEVKIIPSNDLIEAIAFAHDIGHPPFGHNGEVALNYMMRDHGGFEGNGQSLRQLARLEKRLIGSEPKEGLNLTRRTLLGILKYPVAYSKATRLSPAAPVDDFIHLKRGEWNPPKSYLDTEKDIVDWILHPLSTSDRVLFEEWKTPPTAHKNGKSKHNSFDCSLLELADDIAYATHDCEDGIVLGFITPKTWSDLLNEPSSYATLQNSGITSRQQIEGAWDEWKKSPRVVGMSIPAFAELEVLLFKSSAHRRKAISHLIGALIHSVEIQHVPQFASPLLGYRANLLPYAKVLLNFMKGIGLDLIINSSQVQTLEFRGRILVLRLFDALASDPQRLLTESDRVLYDKASQIGAAHAQRIICDYVAGMTDAFAVKMYNRLYVPGSGSIFERI